MKQLLSILFLIIFFASSSSLYAQKPTPKFIKHERFLPGDNNTLLLSAQIEQYFNEYGDMTRQEYFYKDANDKLQSDRKILLS